MFAAADSCTWTGATSANWSDGSNWTGCDNGGVPENGDALVFPSSASNKTTNNDLSSLQVASITINGTGYTLGGNGFTITSNLGITAAQSATISANVTYNTGSHVNFYPASGATLTLSGVSNFTMSSFYETNIGSSVYTGTVDFTGNITGSSAAQFVVVGGATAIVRGASNTYTVGAVGAENNGIFECRSATCFGNNANIIYLGGGRIDMYNATTYTNTITTSVSTPDDSVIAAHAGIVLSGNATINDDILLQQDVNASLELSGTISNVSTITTLATASGSDVHLTGVISGNGNLHLSDGVTYIYGNNTYTGQTVIDDQAIAVISSGTSFGDVSTGTTINQGGAVVISVASPTTIPEPITVAGSGNGGSPAAIALDSGDDATLSGAITLAGDTTMTNVNSGGTTLALTGVIGGTGNLTLTGAWDAFSGGYVEVGGSSPNTFTGDVLVNGGTVYFNKTGAIPHNLTVDATDPAVNRAHAYFYISSNVMSDTGIVTMGEDETNHLTFGANNEVIGGLSGAGGTIQLQDDGDRLIIDQDMDTTFAGRFYMDNQAAVIEKRGNGHLTLTGGAGSVADEIVFVLTEGILTINGNVRTSSGGNVTVNGGTLRGRGVIGALTATGGVVAPGNSPGRLDVASLSFSASNTLRAEIAGPSAGSQYDQIVATGAVTLGGATLQLVPSYTPTSGTVFTLIQGSAVSGIFAGLPDGATLTANGLRFRINYTATTVTATYVDGALAPNTGLLHKSATSMIVAIIGGFILIAGAAFFMKRVQRRS